MYRELVKALREQYLSNPLVALADSDISLPVQALELAREARVLIADYRRQDIGVRLSELKHGRSATDLEVTCTQGRDVVTLFFQRNYLHQKVVGFDPDADRLVMVTTIDQQSEDPLVLEFYHDPVLGTAKIWNSHDHCEVYVATAAWLSALTRNDGDIEASLGEIQRAVLKNSQTVALDGQSLPEHLAHPLLVAIDPPPAGEVGDRRFDPAFLKRLQNYTTEPGDKAWEGYDEDLSVLGHALAAAYAGAGLDVKLSGFVAFDFAAEGVDLEIACRKGSADAITVMSHIPFLVQTASGFDPEEDRLIVVSMPSDRSEPRYPPLQVSYRDDLKTVEVVVGPELSLARTIILVDGERWQAKIEQHQGDIAAGLEWVRERLNDGMATVDNPDGRVVPAHLAAAPETSLPTAADAGITAEFLVM